METQNGASYMYNYNMGSTRVGQSDTKSDYYVGAKGYRFYSYRNWDEGVRAYVWEIYRRYETLSSKEKAAVSSGDLSAYGRMMTDTPAGIYGEKKPDGFPGTDADWYIYNVKGRIALMKSILAAPAPPPGPGIEPEVKPKMSPLSPPATPK